MQTKTINSERNETKAKKRSVITWKSMLLIVAIYIGIMAMMIGVSFGHITSVNGTLTSVDHWLKSNNTVVILWHIFLIWAIWWGWGKKVDADARKSGASQEVIKRAKAFRYYLIGIMLLIDLFLIVYRVL